MSRGQSRRNRRSQRRAIVRTPTRNPDYRRIEARRSTRSSPIMDELPLQQVNNQMFQQIFGPLLRHEATPQARNVRNRWQVFAQPTNEPGMFRDRLDFRYPTNLMVPQSNRDLNDRQLRTLYGEQRWSVLVSFTTTLERWINQQEQQYTMGRVYLVHDSNQLDILGIYPHSDNPNRQFNIVRGWQQKLQLALARTLMDFTEQYYDELGRIDRNLSHLRIFVDLAPQNMGGGARNGLFPEALKHVKSTLFNPSSGQCFFKCLKHATGLNLPALQLLFVDVSDHQNYRDLFQKASEVLPKYSYRLFSVTGFLIDRIDGLDFTDDDFTTIIAFVIESAHWYRITNIPEFILKTTKNEFYCYTCDRQEKDADCNHRCVGITWQNCDRCNYRFHNKVEASLHKQQELLGSYEKLCLYCGKHFYSEGCLDYHTLVCKARKAAEELKQQQKKEAKTKYYSQWREENLDSRLDYERKYDQQRRQTNVQCFNCHKRYILNEGHECYLEKRNEKDPQFEEWYAFDYEAMLTPHPTKANVLLHTVNYVCVAQLWSDKNWQFESLEDYFSWMRETLVPTGKTIGMIAHNLKGYDGRLTLAKMFEDQSQRGSLVEEMIWTMAKINTFKWNNIIFRDSLLHIPQPLALWPKTFDLKGGDVEISKGYFPYLFNTPENQSYVGPIPHLKYFEPNMKSPSDRSKFLKWYDSQKEVVYNFKEELKKYCIADVNILARGLEVYSQAGKLLNGQKMDPLEKLTIASYTTNVWFTNHFPEKTLVWHNQQLADNARLALRGGKTDIRQFYKKYSLEDIFVHKKYASYVDVQSMYPFVMYKYEYPVGKALIKYENCTIEDIRSCLGFACVTVDPPPFYVHHPALVHVRNGRLCATLETWYKTVFTTVELWDALDQGWTIRSIEWIQHYEGKSTDLFKAYIEKLVSEKIHSSKLDIEPEKLEQLKKKWLDEFNIELKEAEIQWNAGRRALAKLMLNSLWGKLSERFKSDFAINVDAQLFKAYEIKELKGEIDINHKYRLNDDTWLLVGKKNLNVTSLLPGDRLRLKQDMTEHNRKTCVEIGAFVTMYGRRMLYKEMLNLGRRVIYHDTDSIIYEYNESEVYNVSTGNVLGDWEVENDGNPIIEFVGLAPKTYAYRYLDIKNRVKVTDDLDYSKHIPYKIWDGYLYHVKEECKVKGFKLHYDARIAINFDGLLELYKQDKVCLQAKQLVFDYSRATNEITSRIVDKCLIFNYEKGVIGAEDVAYPFGVEKYWDSKQRYVEEGTPLKENPVELVE